MFQGIWLMISFFVWLTQYYFWVVYIAYVLAEKSHDPKYRINWKKIFLYFFPVISWIYIWINGEKFL
jgi:hypothetical protein